MLIPFATYIASYVYLAIFHHKVWLWNTVVHESGKLTLLETTLYASHFLGHIPSLVVIALLFATWYKILSDDTDKGSLKWMAVAAAFSGICFFISVALFGMQDTLDYLTLSKQSEVRNEPGGSYLLHLPSTLSLVILIPLYIGVAQSFFGQALQWQPKYFKELFSTIAAALLIALLIAPSGVIMSLMDPRYLAHSVRELATFPLTYFPIPIAFWLSGSAENAADRGALRYLTVMALLAIPLVSYQAIVPLVSGIDSLAQQPVFSDHPLPISYLLASHYFEHVLDTIFFTLICFALISPRGVKFRRFLSS